MSNEAAAVAAPESSETGGTKSWQTKLGMGVVVGCALLALFWPGASGPRPAPPGMLVDAGGRPVPLATRSAPVTLVHFWATWCPPCIDEVPSIQRLEEDFDGNHNFSLIMIAVADDSEKVKTFLGNSFHNSLFDHEWKVSHSYGTRKLPETHLVVNGEIVESFIGATNWDLPKVRKQIEAAVAQVQSEEAG
ncbi:MAG: TlpA disulfide reductase family protein [Acidobacteriota bacterium]